MLQILLLYAKYSPYLVFNLTCFQRYLISIIRLQLIHLFFMNLTYFFHVPYKVGCTLLIFSIIYKNNNYYLIFQLNSLPFK